MWYIINVFSVLSVFLFVTIINIRFLPIISVCCELRQFSIGDAFALNVQQAKAIRRTYVELLFVIMRIVIEGQCFGSMVQ